MEPHAGMPLEVTESPRGSLSAPVAPAFNVIKEERFTVPTLRVHDAVMQLNLLDSQFLVFTNADSRHVSVVYRRNDGNYGLIETAASPAV